MCIRDRNMTCHVRDPKVWMENNKFYMVQGARDKDDIGQVLLFEAVQMQRKLPLPHQYFL